MNKQQELLERVQRKMCPQGIEPCARCIDVADLIAEIKRLDGHMERLSNEKPLRTEDERAHTAGGHHAIFELRSRTQYAVDHRYPPLTGEDR